jgi:hypothetical protein
MDVLRYSAENAKDYLTTQVSEKSACIAVKGPQTTALAVSASLFTPEYSCWVRCIEPSLLANPAQTSLWSCVAAGSGWTGGFTVCGDDGVVNQYFSQGKDCTWTVPSGVTCARFQIWGAGGSSGAAGCCGGSPFGGSGAYASVIMPVTAGCQYILCAGCALCCYGCWNCISNGNGCASYITGPGLTNFCAMGGIGNLCQQMIDRDVYYYKTGIIDARPAYTCQSFLGYCICGTGSSFCSTTISTPFNEAVPTIQCCGSGFSSNPHMMLPAYHSSALSYGSATGGTVYGIAGAYGESCMAHYCKCGYHKNPPIYGFESSSQCVFSLSSSTSCGGNYCSASATFGAVLASLLLPGSGGFAMQVAGGCLSICGDAGRMGMVCVCFK